MNDFFTCTLTGVITSNPVLSRTYDGKDQCSFGVGVRKYIRIDNKWVEKKDIYPVFIIGYRSNEAMDLSIGEPVTITGEMVRYERWSGSVIKAYSIISHVFSGHKYEFGSFDSAEMIDGRLIDIAENYGARD